MHLYDCAFGNKEIYYCYFLADTVSNLVNTAPYAYLKRSNMYKYIQKADDWQSDLIIPIHLLTHYPNIS